MQFTDVLPERIARKLVLSSENSYNGTPCWEYTGYLERNGYAKVSWNGKTSWLHRIVCTIAHGEAGEVTEHACDNRKCCCPNHLRPGTFKTNTADMIAKRRLKGAVATHVYRTEA